VVHKQCKSVAGRPEHHHEEISAMGNSNIEISGLSERLTKLEEAETFGQRTIEELNSEVVELNRRVGEVMARLERLEARLDTAAADAQGPNTEEDSAQSP
jgi:uncharacterized coiled-coil protein SlyX